MQTEGGNISAQELGLAEAFDTVEKSTKSIVDFVSSRFSRLAMEFQLTSNRSTVPRGRIRRANSSTL